jgi:hypothetical protein
MKILQWFKDITTKQTAVSRALTLFLPLDQGVRAKADYATLTKEGFTENSVVFACIKEISGAAAGVDWLLFERMPDGTRKKILAHPLLDLIARPNPVQGKFEFIEAAIGYLYVSGNAYLEMVGPAPATSNHPGIQPPPKEIYALRPDRMKVVPHPVNLVAGYEYSVSGQTVRMTRERILHLKLFHPLDDWYGLSPIQVAALAIDKLNAGDKGHPQRPRTVTAGAGSGLERAQRFPQRHGLDRGAEIQRLADRADLQRAGGIDRPATGDASKPQGRQKSALYRSHLPGVESPARCLQQPAHPEIWQGSFSGLRQEQNRGVVRGSGVVVETSE